VVLYGSDFINTNRKLMYKKKHVCPFYNNDFYVLILYLADNKNIISLLFYYAGYCPVKVLSWIFREIAVSGKGGIL